MSCGAQIKAWGCVPSGEALLEVPEFLGSCQILPTSKPAVATSYQTRPCSCYIPGICLHPSPGSLSPQLTQKASSLHSLPLGHLRQSDCRLQIDQSSASLCPSSQTRAFSCSPTEAPLFLLGLKPFLFGRQYSCCDINKTHT